MPSKSSGGNRWPAASALLAQGFQALKGKAKQVNRIQRLLMTEHVVVEWPVYDTSKMCRCLGYSDKKTTDPSENKVN
jgi:hypothetical protein